MALQVARKLHGRQAKQIRTTRQMQEILLPIARAAGYEGSAWHNVALGEHESSRVRRALLG